MRGTVESSGDEVVVLRMPPALTAEGLEAILSSARGVDAAHTVVVDASEMRDYTPEARSRFIQFARALPRRTRLGIITKNPMWRIVIAAMGLAASREIRVFPDLVGARAWQGPPPT
jgi:hypothetical protein